MYLLCDINVYIQSIYIRIHIGNSIIQLFLWMDICNIIVSMHVPMYVVDDEDINIV